MSDSRGASTVANIVGVVLLILFGAAVVYLLNHVTDTELQWSRLAYIFGGVEAMAFAAAGYFFGKEVNRERADSAEEKAKEAENKAKDEHGKKSQAETKLASLVKYIETQAPTSSAHSSGLADLLKLAQQPGIGERAPQLMASIEAKHSAAASVPDERWDGLAKFARSL